MINSAVLIPCYNEAQTIKKVIADFRSALPGSEIYVCDNCSTDNTAKYAREAGATVFYEARQGKGYAIRNLFKNVNADVYILVDGDATYEPLSAPKMIECLIQEKYDMVVGLRKHTNDDAFRSGHQFGNKIITTTVNRLFQSNYCDILSGFRVMTHAFVKSFPLDARGFDIETEITVHAAQLNISVKELGSPYYARPTGSQSKLHTLADGWKILIRIVTLFHDIRPLLLFSTLALIFALIGVALGIPILLEFIHTGLVPRFPTAILCTGLMIFALIFLTAGIILNGIARLRRENKYLHYLMHST